MGKFGINLFFSFLKKKNTLLIHLFVFVLLLSTLSSGTQYIMYLGWLGKTAIVYSDIHSAI